MRTSLVIGAILMIIVSPVYGGETAVWIAIGLMVIAFVWRYQQVRY